MISFDNLIAIHEMLWPETNLDQQIKKWEEEYNEWSKAGYDSEEELYELADMVIVSAGVARFNYTHGIGLLFNTIYTAALPIDEISELWQAVEIKMRKNMKRDWAKKDDVGYKHI